MELTDESGVSGLTTICAYFSSNHYFQARVSNLPLGTRSSTKKIQPQRKVSMYPVSLKLILLSMLSSPGLAGGLGLRERASLARCVLPF